MVWWSIPGLDIKTQIIIYLSIALFFVLYILAFSFGAIKDQMLWKFFRRHYIRAIIIQKDKVLLDKPIKVSGKVDFKEGDNTYTIDHSCVYLLNGKIPVLIYEAGDPQPKNVLSETVEQLLNCPECKSEILMTFKKPVFPSGEELDNMMMRAKSAGLIKGLMKELPFLINLLYVIIGVCIVVVLGIYLLYDQLPTKIVDMLLPRIQEAVNRVIIT